MELDEAQRIIYQTAKRFAAQHILPQARERAEDESFPLEVMRLLAEAGLYGGPFPEQYGGAGIDNVSYALVCEAIGGASPSVFTSALTVQLSLVGTSIYAYGNEEQRRRWLPQVLSGRLVGAFALSEPNVGSDPAAVELTARRENGCWRLTGSKFWTSNGALADVIVVFAQTEPGARHRGMAAFLVDGNSPGLTRQPIKGKLGLHASNLAALYFDGVLVDDDRLLGQVGEGFRVAQAALESGRLSTAACAVGIAQTCLDLCLEYARERKQWGKPIGGHQLVQELLADMAIECEAARLLTLRAARARDSGEGATRWVAMAKAFATEAAVRAARNAIAVHGGAGYLSERLVEGYLRDAIGLSLYEGTTQIQKLLVARDLLGISAF